MSKWKFAPEHDSIKDRCVIVNNHAWENGWYGIYSNLDRIDYFYDHNTGIHTFKKDELELPIEVKNEYLKWLIKNI